ncbi:hypothetical protein RvY_00191-1 [Ramazzottius varieornatus]|uniref:Uncharacterized protein n=1 Tax=Ramazzottius varieornatus TaxID=947166 RepID=A0A1D1UBW8_RAMVA|nr:hypothetical protein RvY_00191-1 [Ramazzottius varieornatus]
MGNVSTLKNRTVRYADLSGNKIKDLDGVALPNIARLRLDFNRISSLDILNGHDFRFLRKLELRGNRLKSTAGIKHASLEELYLVSNGAFSSTLKACRINVMHKTFICRLRMTFERLKTLSFVPTSSDYTCETTRFWMWQASAKRTPSWNMLICGIISSHLSTMRWASPFSHD